MSSNKPNNGREGEPFRTVKNRYRSKKDRGTNPQSRNSTKFKGLNKDELEGITICETNQAPTAQQYDVLLDALVVYAGSKNARVKTSIRSLKYLTLQDFKPDPPDPSVYTTPVKGGVDVVDKDIREAAMDIWKAESALACKQYASYKDSIDGLFETIIGQLGKDVLNNLKGTADWKTIDDESNTVRLLEILRELCYRDNSTKVHPVDDLIRKMLKFLQSRQNEKSASAFAEETTNKSDVLKSAGGSILSPSIIKYTLSLDNVLNGKFTYDEYKKLSSSNEANKKIEIEDAARQVILARVIIRGSNDKKHQGLRIELEKDYAKGHDNYPRTATEALDLLNRYKARTKPANVDRGKDLKQDKTKEDKNKAEEGNQLTTIGEPCSDQPTSDGELETAHQLLTNASEENKSKHDDRNENGPHGFMFYQNATEQLSGDNDNND